MERLRHPRRHRLAPFLEVVVAGGALLALTTALLVPEIGAVLSAHNGGSIEILLDPLAQRSIVLASDGKTVLGVLHGDQNRKVVPFADIPAVVVATVLAVEDKSFYEHGAVDVRSMVRALFTNVKAGDVRQGGSTITQQLVKNALLDNKQDFGRKVKEAALAFRLERQLSKQEILERYLNTVYLGNGTYGMQAAAETYFGKDAKDLDRADAALLAGMIKNPAGYDPIAHASRAKERRAEVVRRLRKLRVIDGPAAAAILRAPLPDKVHSVLPKPDDYFVNEVIRRLLHDRLLGRTRSARYQALFTGGLTITTTLDAHWQELAAAAVKDTLPDTDGKFTAALVAEEPRTGAIRALVGGPGFERSKYNIATQGLGRQVGSAMKPFVLAAALEQGISPRSTILGSSPCSFRNPGGAPDPYKAENYGGSQAGVVSLYSATKNSVNCAYLRLGQIVGLENVVSMARKLGVTARLGTNLALPLGTSEIHPIDMASAFATFAAGGIYREPYFVQRILDRSGKTVYRHEARPQRVISSEVANEVTDVLKGVITGGTARAARFADRRPAAGKTGTTSDHSDAWFVGYTRQLSTAVWMGSPVGRVEMRHVGSVGRVTGGSYPARIWQAFMGPAHEGLPEKDFPEPDVAYGKYLSVPRGIERNVVWPTATTTMSGPPSMPINVPPLLPPTTTTPPATTTPPTTTSPVTTSPVTTGQTGAGA